MGVQENLPWWPAPGPRCFDFREAPGLGGERWDVLGSWGQP